MVAGSHIGFDLDNIRTPAKCNCWSEVVLKFGLDRIHRFEDIVIFIFCRFGLKLPIHAHFFLGGGGCWGYIFTESRPSAICQFAKYLRSLYVSQGSAGVAVAREKSP